MELYNSKADILVLKRTALVAASDIMEENPDFLESLERLADSPLKFRGSRGESLTVEDALDTLRRHAGEGRGLESKVCRLLGRHQRWAITAVLRCQMQLQSDGVEGGISRERVLRKRCEFVNKGPKQLALLFAKIDEEEARTFYSESSL
jgi:hypothetical protein